MQGSIVGLLKDSQRLHNLYVDSFKKKWSFHSMRPVSKHLTSSPVLQPPNWELPFELMSNASNYAVRAVLGQRVGKIPHAIYYASRTRDEAQANYTSTEIELLVVVFALDKFRSHLLGTKIVVFTDHALLKFLLSKKEAKTMLIRWILLLQEFNVEVRDKKGSDNSVADHFSRLVGVNEGKTLINEEFPDEKLHALSSGLCGMLIW